MATVKDTVNSNTLTTAIGGAPSAGDDVIINRFGGLFNAGLDLTAGGTVALNSLTFGQGFTGGTADNSIITVDISTAADDELVCNHRGSDIRISSAGASISVLKMIDSGTGEMFVTSGEVVNIEQRGGRLSISDSATIDGTINIVDGALSLGAAASDTVTTLNCTGGGVTLRRAATTVNLGGSGIVTLAEDSKAVGTVNLFGGTFRHLGDGTITAATVRAGATLDLRGVSGNVTVTTLTIERGAIVLLPSAFTATIGTFNKLANAEPLTRSP